MQKQPGTIEAPATGPASDRVPAGSEPVVDKVRERYGKIAAGAISGCCNSERAVSQGIGYTDGDLAAVPDQANLGLGCGAPIDHLELQVGETVLDLGSGAGLDAFLAARSVGPQGRVIGIDMTPAMLDRARRGAVEAGLNHVEFREGRLESLPVASGSVDAVTSNCVINLVPDKGAVFREVARVLRPGGRLVVSDIVLDGDLPEAITTDVLAYVGCIAGALRREAYLELIAAAGLTSVEILKDIDYLAAAGELLPGELRQRIASAGVAGGDLQGMVRSLTFRARKPTS